jgi:hypothetical protein
MRNDSREIDSTSREAFELFITTEKGWDKLSLERSQDGSYVITMIECAWIGWLAAQSRHAAEREALVNALKLALEYWQHRQQRYKNRHPVWVEAANEALALLSDSGSQG